MVYAWMVTIYFYILILILLVSYIYIICWTIPLLPPPLLPLPLLKTIADVRRGDEY